MILNTLYKTLFSLTSPCFVGNKYEELYVKKIQTFKLLPMRHCEPPLNNSLYRGIKSLFILYRYRYVIKNII